MSYTQFLNKKVLKHKPSGFVPQELNKHLFAFQADIVAMALQRGKFAIFADCGLGKTLMQLEWAHQIVQRESKPVLILAPLAVAAQTISEGKKFGIQVTNLKPYLSKNNITLEPGIYITNYEQLENIYCVHDFIGVVLDESSILKSYMGSTKQLIVNTFKATLYKLACTATPSPNDYMELLNHSAFLGMMESHEALAIWFINDTMNMGTYRLKHYARESFFEWVSEWAVSISKPSDLNPAYSDAAYILPKLHEHIEVVQSDLVMDIEAGRLFQNLSLSATNFNKEKRNSLTHRLAKTIEIINSKPREQFVVWCETNEEADILKHSLVDAKEIRGADRPEAKEQAGIGFINREYRILISKPSIFGFGVNFQTCHNCIFFGLSFSFEMYYQATRRFYRFGQNNDVHVYVVIGGNEYSMLETIKQKEEQHLTLTKSTVKGLGSSKQKREYTMDYKPEYIITPQYQAILGDCVEEITKLQDGSMDYSIYSPPFANLYIYSDSYRDMGNCKNDDEFFEHYQYLLFELYRILRPGRLMSVHCKQLVNYKGRDGRAGLRDFRGDIIRACESAGFQYHSEVCIWKDPVIEMQRTKAHGLLYKQLRADSTYSRQGMPDYLVTFRKWAEVDEVEIPVTKTKEQFGLNVWQNYASPVWMDINQTNVLNKAIAKDAPDEKHICPLQLDVIQRALHLWTNPNDMVFSPFMGVGSEGYMSLKCGRRFTGIELKDSYFKQAVSNLNAASEIKDQLSLFPGLELMNVS